MNFFLLYIFNILLMGRCVEVYVLRFVFGIDESLIEKLGGVVKLVFCSLLKFIGIYV